MAHRCVKCGKIYSSTAPEILKGCTCGSHYFFFFREEDKKALDETKKLTRVDREEIIKDVDKIIGEKIEKPVVLNLESIRIKKPGQFELDLVNILKRKPIIYKVEEGKYMLDIASTFQLRSKLSEKEKEIEKVLEEEPENNDEEEDEKDESKQPDKEHESEPSEEPELERDPKEN